MYVLTTIITCFMAYLANVLLLSKNKKNVRYGKLIMICIIVMFSMVAGLRDYTIGTDISFYVRPIFNYSINNTLTDLFVMESTNLEPLYLILNYVSANVFNNMGAVLFCLQFIVILFVVMRICDYTYTKKMWIGILAYNCLYFPISLNLMRQSIAMAILFWGSRYLFGEKCNIKKYLICMLFSVGFHVTGIIGLVFLFCSLYYSKHITTGRDKSLFIKSLLLVAGTIVAIMFFDKAVEIIAGLAPFMNKFNRYSEQAYSGFQINPFLIRIPLILLTFLSWKEYKKGNNENYLLFIFVVFDLLLAQLRAYSAGLYRLSIYFAYFKMIQLPCMIYSNRRYKIITTYTVCFILIITWYYQIVLQGNEEVYPYIFRTR